MACLRGSLGRRLLAVVVIAAPACVQILDADKDYHLRQDCASVEDCVAPEPACRPALACEEGGCVFEDAPEGTAVPDQVAGDCAQMVCDGLGGITILDEPADLPDDGSPCTEDTCNGGAPVFTPRAQAPCYDGPPQTRGVGRCEDGVLSCDAQGHPQGACLGQVLPGVETCATSVDDDCNGLVNDCAVVAMEAGAASSCAILMGGELKCWGDNPAGQLGLGDTLPRGEQAGQMGASLPSVDLGAGRSAKQIAVGTMHACVVSDSGEVLCWGANEVGQLGLGDTESRGGAPFEMGGYLTPVDLGPFGVAQTVVAGANHTCALLWDATLRCWGWNHYGQLGVGDTVSRGTGPDQMGAVLPDVRLGLGRYALSVAAGAAHTCAILDDHHVKCWGENNSGQLGLGDEAHRGDDIAEMGNSLPAVDLGANRTAAAIAAGSYHTCALLDDGSVKCWGNNQFGSLGQGDVQDRGDEPGEMGEHLHPVDLGGEAVAIAAGGYHTCALLDDGRVKCWGYNHDGQLGLGDTLSRGDSPGEMGDALPAVDLGTSLHAAAIVAGVGFNCAVIDDGGVKCWGYNHEGELGLGDIEDRGDDPGEMGDSLPFVELF